MHLSFEDLSEILNRINGWITNCDSKVSIILSAYGVLAGILLAMDYISKFISILKLILNDINLINIILILLCSVSLLALLGGALFMISSLFAKVRVEEFSNRGVKTDSLIFFSTIAKNSSLSEYQTKLTQSSTNEIMEDLISQIYICSLICDKKFSHYQRGLKCLLLGTVLLIAFLFCVVIKFSQ